MAVPGRKDFPTSSSNLESQDIKLFCQPCEQISSRLPAIGYCLDCAEHLCQSCYNSHKKAKPCRNHTLLDAGAMPKTQQPSSSTSDSAQVDNLTKPCPKHTKEVIKFFCKRHNALLCTVCGMLEHRSCKIKYIPDIAGRTEYIKDYSNALQKMKEILSQCQTVKLKSKTATEESNSSLTDALAELKVLRQDVNKKFDELEKQLEDEAKSLQEENNQRLQKKEETCNEIAKSIKPLSDSMEQLSKLTKVDKLFVELKNAEKTIQNHQSAITELGKKTYTRKFKFKEDTWVSTILKKDRLGVFEQKPVKSICVKTPTDSYVCEIRGMVLLNNRLILVDHGNNSVKMVDIDSETIISTVILSKQPYDITAVTNNEVAVTLPWTKTIQFLSTAGNKLTLSHNFKVKGHCYGISSYEENLLLIHWYSGRLEVLDKTGTMLRTATIDSESDDSVTVDTDVYDDAEPSGFVSSNEYDGQDSDEIFLACVQCDSSAIYISENEKNAVIMLTWQGKKIGSYEGFGSVQGLALKENGMVLVCDKKRGSVTEISSNFREKNIILRGLVSPYAICCDDEQNLYISSCNSKKIHGNFIKVYRL